MLKKSQQFFKKIDLFGQNITLNLNGENQFKTGGGGFLSCLIVAIVTIFFQSNIIDFLSKINITAETQVKFEENPDRITFNTENFMFALSIDQPVAYNTNPYFNITIQPTTKVRLDNGTTIKYLNYTNLIHTASPCPYTLYIRLILKMFNKYNVNFTDQFNQLGLSTWMCPEQNFSLTVGGRFSSEYLDYVKIEVSACKNNTQNNTYLTWHPSCANATDMQNYLAKEGSFRVRMYMTNTIVNAGDPTNYVQGFLDDEIYFQFVPQTLSRRSNVYFQKYQLVTDQSLLPVFHDKQVDNIYLKQPGDFRDTAVLGSPKDTTFIEMYLWRSPYTKYITREFEKADELLSYLGGFVNIVVVCLGFIISFYNKQQYLIELANKVYDFNFEKTINNQEDKNAELMGKLVQINQKTLNYHLNQFVDKNVIAKDTNKQDLEFKINVKEAILHEADAYGPKQIHNIKPEFQKQQEEIVSKLGFKSRKEYLTNQIQTIMNKTSHIQFTFRFFFHQLTGGRCFKDKTSILLMKAVDKINEDIDIYVILEKVKEIKLLKELMLDKNQQILFNFAPKQIISLTEEKRLPSRLEIYTGKKRVTPVYQGSAKAYQKLYKAYEQITETNQNIDRVNGILMNKLGQEIRDIFNVSQLIDFDLIETKLSRRVKYVLKAKARKIKERRKKQDSEEQSSENQGLVSLKRCKSDISEVFNKQTLNTQRNV